MEMGLFCPERKRARLKVGMIGVDARMRQALEGFFSGPAAACAQLTTHNDAEVDLVNLSELLSWKLYRRIQKRPCIVLSRHKIEAYDAVWVPKPLKKSELLKAVKRVGQYLPVKPSPQTTDHARVQSLLRNNDDAVSGPELLRLADKVIVSSSRNPDMLCGVMEDREYLNTASSSCSYQPEESLQSVLSNAIHFASESGRCIAIEGLSTTLMVLAGGRLVFSELSDDILAEVCSRSYKSSGLRLKALDSEFMVNDCDQGLRRSDEYLWLVSLLCSSGRLPVGYSLHQSLKLKACPNFSRVSGTPHAVQIATLWQRCSLSVFEVSQELEIDLRFVVALLSACVSAGLFDGEEAMEFDTSSSAEESGLVRRFSGLLFR